MNATKSENPVKTLVILLNMGGPQNKDEVHPYLKELFKTVKFLNSLFKKYWVVTLRGDELLIFKKDMKKLVNIPQPRELWMISPQK